MRTATVSPTVQWQSLVGRRSMFVANDKSSRRCFNPVAEKRYRSGASKRRRVGALEERLGAEKRGKAAVVRYRERHKGNLTRSIITMSTAQLSAVTDQLTRQCKHGLSAFYRRPASASTATFTSTSHPHPHPHPPRSVAIRSAPFARQR